MKRLGIIAAALLLCMGTACQTAPVTQEMRNVISYSTEKEVHVVLPENQQKLTLYRNDAKNLSSYELFTQMLRGDGVYIGRENFARLENEVVFLQTSLKNYDSASQADIDYILYSSKNGKEPVEIDRGVQAITCSSDHALYYEKNVDGTLRQFCYSDGNISEVGKEFGGDLTLITHCSRDGSVQGFVSADIEDDGTYLLMNGYIRNGEIFYFENPQAEVAFLSPDGTHMYTAELADEYGRCIDICYVDEQGNLLTAADAVSEVAFYEDSGSMLCIADTQLSDSVMNPIGTLTYFDASSLTASAVADDAVALIEATERSYPWLNEGSKEMMAVEQSRVNYFEQPLSEGDFHYINSSGTLCAVDTDRNTIEIFSDFYTPETYIYNDQLFYLSAMDDTFYWNCGDKIYRYRAGSMAEAETVTLDDTLTNKIESGLEIGYVLCKDGAVLEQCGNTLNLKPFDGASSTVYDSPTQILVMGLDEKAETVYFLSGTDLMGKHIFSNDEAFLVAENVFDAAAVDNSLYAICDYGDEGGELYHIDYSSGKKTALDSGVFSLTDTMIQK